MPEVQPPSKILVTGANGYIAMWVIQTLLEQGYSVRGTVRCHEKGKHPMRYFAKYGDKFEIVVVEEIIESGAFDEAVDGVDAIQHIASPLDISARKTKGLVIEPAVKGTLRILQSASKSPSMRRVVITSSVGAIMHEVTLPTTFNENDWNLQCLENLRVLGENARHRDMYRASKTLAEQAAWKFMEEHARKIKWDLVVLNPPHVFGPAIHEATSPSSLNLTARIFYDHIVDGTKAHAVDSRYFTQPGGSWIDVRDLAQAHKLALQKQEAGRERIIVSAGVWKWQDFIDAANALNPAPRLSKPIFKGNVGAGDKHLNTVHPITFDTRKANRIFGITYHTPADMVKDTLSDFEARGW